MDKTNALTYIENNQDRIKAFASGLTTPAAGVLSRIATGRAGIVTIFVLAYLMVLEGPKVVDGTLNLLRDDTRPRVRAVSADWAKSITGYLSGNLLISVICGVLTYITLLVAGVPFAGLIALFVALADLTPLVGATLGRSSRSSRRPFTRCRHSSLSRCSSWSTNSWRTTGCNHSSCPAR